MIKRTGVSPGFLMNRVIMKFALAKKLGMTQVVNGEGKTIPVTLVGVEDAVVLQLKTPERDGYAAVQIGAGQRKEKSIPKALKGHFKNLGNFRHVKEFRVGDVSGYQVGDKLTLDDFSAGEYVKVSATSTGRGFQGVVKRHGFKGGPASHGHRDVLRRPGAIGGRFPQRVLKGKRMAGRMGGERVSVKNLEIIRVDKTNGILAVKGAVPGKRGTLVEIRS